MISGIGYNNGGKFASRENGKSSYGYLTWKHMIERCYDPKYSEMYPTYKGCEVEVYFHDFQNFMEWATIQIGYGEDKIALDKDLILKGNKIYSRDTCVFIPREVNGVLPKCEARRGEYPVGVCLNQGRYMATLCIDGKNKNLGRFATPEDAFSAYKEAKESNIKRLAEKYKKVLDPRAYRALLCYDVCITD